ncbi:5-hydroxytryptamine receptor 3A-like [Parambassis ranga]|uniref:5-hydroxytryptamine receptor 3A-like n=1 Tax=Parambassis ranga TaxID=210632 RepID=A0A6P7IEP6_9TELE|nr:5-hydroxytryptamine receptor 3A-like [Parambassis ranga]
MVQAASLFLIIFILTDVASCKKVCSYQDVLDHLNLTTDNSVFRLTRPVLDHTHPTIVQLDIILYAILAVIEKTQTFVPFVWASMMWSNERISWDPAQFCGITQVSLPQDLLWKPDIFIYEMTQKDESPYNPYVYIFHDGTVATEQDVKVVSTCKMDVYKFPFDTQSCNISVSSAMHSVDELRLLPYSNSSRATQFSQKLMKSQGEWEFLQLAVINTSFTYEDKQWDQIIYKFTMKRRPLLHVINFLLPILFFLCLDIASFFIADHRGEKLGFKVTVLLAISVLLLILNDILPSMSNKTPLIATYCIVIFALMLLSLLETILVTYLMEKQSQKKLRDRQTRVQTDNCNPETRRQTCCSCICKPSDGERRRELLPAAEEVNRGLQSAESQVLLLILEELKDLQKTLNLHLSWREEEEGGREASVQYATRINRAFFIFYIIAVSLFLSLIFMQWNA